MLKTEKRKVGLAGWRPIGLYVSQEEYDMYMALSWPEKRDISKRLDTLILNTHNSEVTYCEPAREQIRIYARLSPEAYQKFLTFPRRGRNSWLRQQGFWPILKSLY